MQKQAGQQLQSNTTKRSMMRALLQVCIQVHVPPHTCFCLVCDHSVIDYIMQHMACYVQAGLHQEPHPCTHTSSSPAAPVRLLARLLWSAAAALLPFPGGRGHTP
jgi:hypothetical protein